MSATQKLTKKQKKGLAFRERKTTGKRQEKNDLTEMEANAIPTMEDQDLAGDDSNTAEAAGVEDPKKRKERNDESGSKERRKEGKVSSKGKGKAEAEDVPVSDALVKSTKRKREGEAEQTPDANPSKAPKRKKGVNGAEAGETKDTKAAKQRFILFVGNLKYTTSREAIQAHFAACDPPPSIRLLTPNVTSGAPQRVKSKGCAFLEFTHRNALQQGLKLHQSDLEGRMINVELTAGGGGKGDSRLAKVRERNKALLEQRTERSEKEAVENNTFPNLPNKPQRFSGTSGMDQMPVTKRTWTVGDVDDGETHRGGKRHKTKSTSTSKFSKTWGTGVNAIPVG
ncbi:hypothetical protein B0H34DRAFT_792396 [Crassisporium funariophilum]|nr:hypothetical protein B0H34DRAFT_792396 [Crassisporium funariophilum]